ncbi:zinc transporter ZIP5 [Misgurnus anguillicaudatus]|uniref:zinc transporter ZIP5 n=1 Tax=Misgurnus anguillicaudatus TaxID=75329 RepID=UPI003CCF2A16
MKMSFKLELYCISFVIIAPIILGTHANNGHIHKPRMLNQSAQAKSTQEHLEEAFEEQGYYLQRLFLHYGENGTLTYEGLQKLLGSLGLGEVSVLEIQHGGVKHSSPALPHSHLHEDQHHPQPTNSPPFIESPHIESEVSGSSGEWHHSKSDYFPYPGLRQRPEKTISLPSKHPTEKHFHGNCLNVTQLLWNFGLGQAAHITPAHFTFICPALLYQIDSGVCLRHTEVNGQDNRTSQGFLRALGWASLALLVISLPSLFALGLAPLLRPSSLQTFLCPMAGMAVGTLCGDALLHLLPHAIFSEHNEPQDAVLKGLSVLGGLYLLFVFESLLRLKQHFKKRKPDAESGRELDALNGTTSTNQNESLETGHGHSHEQPVSGQMGIKSMAWMVVMGDGIHNLTDGLAIGVAFSQSLTGGLSTTIAVFCHELPHELGDLAVLLAAGWPVRRLAVFSVISALLGFVGVSIGTALGNQYAAHSPWILTITAGVFLYVALADMMPEMLHGDAGSQSPLTRFLLQSLGLLIGGAIMLCIALFEDHIAVSLGDL